MKPFTAFNFSGKRVFLRVDFNVPMEAARVVDDTRLVAALPTIRALVQQKSKVVLASHLGRPHGKVDKRYTLEPVAGALSHLLKQPVAFVSDCIGPMAQEAVSRLEPGEVLLLENLRFYPGEEANDLAFAEELASLADVYVNDAFGTAHRAHASTVGVPGLLLEKTAGLLMEKELRVLGQLLTEPKRPLGVLLGGAKIADKIKVLEQLLGFADHILIGGGMAYAFLAAKGIAIGKSLVDVGAIDLAKRILAMAHEKGVALHLPVDHWIVEHIDWAMKAVSPQPRIVEGAIPEGWCGVDIGPKTCQAFDLIIQQMATIFWNGPMGIFEIKACAEGTRQIVEAVAKAHAFSIIGGGDSAAAVKQCGHETAVGFISTGGGASLEFLEGGGVLPGVAVLKD